MVGPHQNFKMKSSEDDACIIKRSISWVLPMYNEIGYIPLTINKIKAILSEIAFEYEIIIIDGGSTDGSVEKLEKLFSSDRSITIIRNCGNKKLGYALRRGFSLATKDIIIYTDFDMPFDFSVINKVIDLIDSCDVIRGYRTGCDNVGFLKKVYTKVYEFIISVFFKIKMRNINFSLKVFRRRLLENIKLKSDGPFIDAEFLIKANKAGYSIKEVGVVYSPRIYGKSNLSSVAVILETLREMVKFYFDIKKYNLNHYADCSQSSAN